MLTTENLIKLDGLIFHPTLAPRFGEYGIPVPLKVDRSQRIWTELLEEFPKLQIAKAEQLPSLNWEDVKLAHDLDFIARLLDAQACAKEIASCYELDAYPIITKGRDLTDMPSDVLNQCRGSYLAAKYALENESSFFLGGGMHHAMRFGGRGFCLLNDVVIAARKMQQDHGVKKVLILDVDAHKGDGTAQITEGDESIFSISIHMAKGWPLDGSLGPGPWDIASDIDIALEADQENLYLNKLQECLASLDLTSFDMALIVLGADAWEHDELASSSGIKLSSQQILERDLLIESSLARAGLARTYVMGGGYGARAHEPYVNFIKKLLN